MLKRIKMKRKWLYVLLGFLWFVFSGLYAQEQTVTGVVKDQDGRPLLGVSVVEKGTTHGVDTDLEGNILPSKCPMRKRFLFSLW